MNLHYRLGRPVVDPNNPSELLVLAEIEAPLVRRTDAQRVHVAVVLDRSGSMGGAPLEIAKGACSLLLKHLLPEHRFTLVTFDEHVDVVAAAVPASEKAALISRIAAIEEGGSTNLSGGWLQASEIALKHLTAGENARIIVLTDGAANAGITEPDKLASMCRALADRGVATSTVGVGLEYNEELLAAMAESGNGNFHHIEKMDQLQATFLVELGELAELYAQNVRLRIEPSPNVRSLELLHDYPFESDPAGITVRLGDIVCGERRAVLTRFLCPEGTGTLGLTAFTLLYQQVAGEIALRDSSTFVEVGYGLTDPAEPLEPVVANNLAICNANAARKKVAEAIANDDLDAAYATLAAQIAELEKLGLTDEAAALRQTQMGLADDLYGSSKTMRMFRSSSTRGKSRPPAP